MYAFGGGTVEIMRDRFAEIEKAYDSEGFAGTTLAEIFELNGYEPTFDKFGNLESLYFEYGEFDKYFLEVLAPFVDQGHMEMAADDGDHWQIVFIDGGMTEYDGMIMYPGSPYNDPY